MADVQWPATGGEQDGRGGAPLAAPLAALLARDFDTAIALLAEMGDDDLEQLKALGYRLDSAIPSRWDRLTRIERGLNPITARPAAEVTS